MEDYIIDFINDNVEVWCWCGQNIEIMHSLMIDCYLSFNKYGGGVRQLHPHIFLPIYDITKSNL